jgi:hypothetical protein
MEYDRHILKSTNKMRISWNLINIERGKDMNNQIIQSIDIDDKTTAIIKLLQIPSINTL